MASLSADAESCELVCLAFIAARIILRRWPNAAAPLPPGQDVAGVTSALAQQRFEFP